MATTIAHASPNMGKSTSKGGGSTSSGSRVDSTQSSSERTSGTRLPSARRIVVSATASRSFIGTHISSHRLVGSSPRGPTRSWSPR